MPSEFLLFRRTPQGTKLLDWLYLKINRQIEAVGGGIKIGHFPRFIGAQTLIQYDIHSNDVYIISC